MQLTCSIKDLSTALASISRIIPPRPSIPILAAVKLEAADGRLWLRGTDLEVSMETSVDSDIAKPGAVCVMARAAADMVKALPGDTVELAQTGEFLQLKYNGGKMLLPVFDPDTFPRFPEAEAGWQADVDLSDLAQRVAVAADKSGAQPLFSGMLWEVAEGRINFVATDTHRLAWLSRPLEGEAPSLRVIVPVRAIEAAARMDAARVTLSQRQAAFEGENVRLITRLIEGRYPNYLAVMPQGQLLEANVDAKEFAGAVERALLVSKGADKPLTNLVRLDWRDGGVTVSGRDSSGMEAAESVGAQVYPALVGQTVSFNGAYLLDAIRCGGGCMRFNTEINGMMVEDEAGGYRHLTLPVIQRNVG